MKTTAIATGAMLLSALLVAQAAEPEKRDVVAFSASVRVDVDAAGKPVKVEAPADLPEAIRGYIEQRVASWQYQSAKIEGVPQSATTYVAVHACAVPVAEGYRLGMDFHGNGVRVAGGERLTGPMFPGGALQGKTEASFVLILGIAPDGHVDLDSIENVDASRAVANKFRPILHSWANSLRFDPERVAGNPVRGQARVLMKFNGRDPRELADEAQIKAKASRECQVAATGDAGLRPVALQPAVTVIPTPAG